MTLVWLMTALTWGIIAGAEFQRYARTKDKRSLFYACCFFGACILALVSAGIFEGWFVRSN